MSSFTEERHRLMAALKKAQEDATKNERAAIEQLEKDFAARKDLYALLKSVQVFEANKAFLTSHPSAIRWESVYYLDDDYYNPGSGPAWCANHSFRAYSAEENQKHIQDWKEGYEHYRGSIGELILNPFKKGYHASDEADAESIRKTLHKQGLYANIQSLYQDGLHMAESLSLEEMDGFIATEKAKLQKRGVLVTEATPEGLKQLCDRLLKSWLAPTAPAGILVRKLVLVNRKHPPAPPTAPGIG